MGKKCDECTKLKVHKNEMKDSQKEKYLGDIISDKGTRSRGPRALRLLVCAFESMIEMRVRNSVGACLEK